MVVINTEGNGNAYVASETHRIYSTSLCGVFKFLYKHLKRLNAHPH